MLKAKSTATTVRTFGNHGKTRREGAGRHRDAGARVRVAPGAGHDDHERGRRADDDRVDEGLEQGDHALANRLFGARRRVGDRGRPDARLVAEGGAPEALDQRPDESAEAGLEAEGLADDQGERARYGRARAASRISTPQIM